MFFSSPSVLANDGDDNAQKRPIRKKLSGMVIPGMTTEKGEIKIDY
jgi:hypothetical protein